MSFPAESDPANVRQLLGRPGSYGVRNRPPTSWWWSAPIDALPTIGALPTGSVARSPSQGGKRGWRRSPYMAATSVPGDRAPSLERDAIGLPEVLFQSITHMAPAVATALIRRRHRICRRPDATGGGFRHGGLPVHCVLDRPARETPAVGRRHVHLCGARPGTVLRLAHGLGVRTGRAADRADPAGGLRLLRRRLPDDLLGIGEGFAELWIVLAIVCGLLLWWLIYQGAAISTRTGVVLGIIEIAIFVFVSAVLIANAGDGQHVQRVHPRRGRRAAAFQG